MKVFISQPMKGLTDEEIQTRRKEIIDLIKKYATVEFEIIDSVIKNYPEEPTNADGLWYLGESLKMLATADVAFFAKGWDDARGCKIEHLCAKEYGIKTIEEK